MERTELTRILASLTDDEFTEIATEARKGTVIPGVGSIPATPPDALAAAEASGDRATAWALKTQKLADLFRQQH